MPTLLMYEEMEANRRSSATHASSPSLSSGSIMVTTQGYHPGKMDSTWGWEM